MVTSKRRQRQLARAKWDRQQSRRVVTARRQRVISLVVGTIVGLIIVALLIWLVVHIMHEEKTRDQTPVIPTDSFSTNLPTTSAVETPSPTEPDTSPGKTGASPDKTKTPDDTGATTGGKQ